MQNNIYSVSQVNKYIKNMFLTDYMLTNLSIRGEVSNCKYHSSGHIYFSLKDEKSLVKCVMFASNRTGLKFQLKEGLQVVVTGSMDVYERDGGYQLYARTIKQEGIGDLYEEFEKLKQKLSEQGMFDPSYKRPIPKYVKTLGVVTAKTGAAVRDIIDVSKRRNPAVEIIVYPALVQGDGASESIIKGIRALEEYGVSCIIVGRGGGSIEDLWAFNDEKLAETIFNCKVPVISAVGHEVDFTIADFVADVRAATPSAAAELANPDMREVINSLAINKNRLQRAFNNNLSLYRGRLDNLNKVLERLSPKNKLNENKLRLSTLTDKLDGEMKALLNLNKHRLSLDSSKLNALSPLAKLEGGYSYVSDTKGESIKTIKSVNVNDKLRIHVTDGVIETVVTGKEEATWQK